MDFAFFLPSLVLAIAGPALALQYLRPILLRVLRQLCDADAGAEFWMRSALLLAVSDTALVVVAFGGWIGSGSGFDAIQRTLVLVLGGVFVSVWAVVSKVWRRVTVSALGPLPRALTFSPRPERPAAPAAASAAPSASAGHPGSVA